MAASRSPAPPRTAVLGDGRRVSWSEYGDADGFPVLNCHGGLLCRSDVEPAEGTAAALGVRIVSPDRPGVGRTDRAPGHDTASWAEDAAELMSLLEVDRFGVMGWSLGGQYALAVAAVVPERVVGAAVIAGCLPLDEDGAVRLAELTRLDRSLVRLSRDRPLVARSYFSLARLVARRGQRAFVEIAARGTPRPDAEAIRAHGSWLAGCVGEALRDTRGAVDEYRAFGAPWGFAPEDVTVPVHLYQGGLDASVPPRWAEELARRIRGSELTNFDGEAHMIGLTRRTEVLSDLVTLAEQDRAR